MKTIRLYYLDNLKTFLTILVIVAHCAITYGKIGSWYYEERTDSAITNLTLIIFVAIIQCFTMGLFFFISGYFAQMTIDKLGKLKFINSRLIKVGIPLLAFTFILNQFLVYIYDLKFHDVNPNYFSFLILSIKNLYVSPGITWFLEALLLFNMLHCLLNFKIFTKFNSMALSTKNIIFYVLIISFATFLMRIKYNLNTTFLALPVTYLLKYITLYFFGAMAFKNQWFEYLTTKKVYRLNIKILASLLFIVPFVFFLGGAAKGNIDSFMFGATWQACFYAFWETYIGIVLSIVLINYFKHKVEFTNSIMSAMSRSAYAVYIFHVFVLMLISFLFINFKIYPLLKFLLVSSLSVPFSFLTCSFIVKLPIVKKIL